MFAGLRNIVARTGRCIVRGALYTNIILTKDYGLTTVDWLPTPNSRLPTPNSRLPSHNSHPFLYSRYKNLFASSLFVIFMLSESYSTLFLARSATAPNKIISVTGPAFKKLPGDCVLFLNASIHKGPPSTTSSFGGG